MADANETTKLKELIGFLSPSGTYTKAEPWAHMETAQGIVEKEYGKTIPGIKAERLLLENGYIGFYSRDVGFYWMINGHKQIPTEDQIQFIEDHLSAANNKDQKKSILELLQRTEDLKEDYILDLYTEKRNS